MPLEVNWGDQWEKLAEDFLEYLDKNPLSNPLCPECVVVNSPAMESWLRHYFVYERRGRGSQRVLANWDVQQLYPFVNDWLFRMVETEDTVREPRYHPYSLGCLRWRLYGLLTDDLLGQDEFVDLKRYCSDADAEGNARLSPRRRFDLGAVLAKLYDDYQVYRPEMLDAWEKGNADDGVPSWQPKLWKALRDQDPKSYLESFRQINSKLVQCRIQARYERVTIFGVSVMPPVYLHFFQHLATILPVRLYTFNPSTPDWYDDKAPREAARLQGALDSKEYIETGNPLLSALGKGCQAYLAEILDRTDGQFTELFGMPPEKPKLLHQVQEDIRNRRTFEGQEKAVDPPLESPSITADDDSLQIHICHSPMREVEVLRDFLLSQFDEYPDLQPRHIQVLVSDLPTYVPYINAVFETQAKEARATFPYSISDRSQISTSPTATAFMTLLNLTESRFKASELMDLLDTESVAAAFGLEATEMSQLRTWIRESGIRWGIDKSHLGKLGLVEMEPTVTWQSGADRMLLGYALGRQDGDGGPALVDAGEIGMLAPCNKIEGGGVSAIGQLLRFIELTRGVATGFAEPCPIGKRENDPKADTWKNRLNELIDNFFRSTNTTYRDVGLVRSAVRDLVRTAEAAKIDEPVNVDIVRSFMQARLDETAPAHNLYHNAVMFSPLQAMRSTPRKVICLLGMDDGLFPRRDRRVSFDLIRQTLHRGDRSHRRDDRLAFLEALMSARDKLYISYIGRTDRANEKMPPSTVVSELKDYLALAFTIPPDYKSWDGNALMFCETLHHLQAFHWHYFQRPTGQERQMLYSYSSSNCAAACGLRERWKVTGERPAKAELADSATTAKTTHLQGGEEKQPIRIESLIRFFVNPAKEYHRNILQVQFEDYSDLGQPDAELFKAMGLDKYDLNEAILDAQLLPIARDAAWQKLVQQARTPLGYSGKFEFEKRWKDIERFLDTIAEEGRFGTPMSMRELLQRHRTAVPKESTATVDGWQVTGQVRPISISGTNWLIACRYSSIKAKDRLRSWLTHLFASLVLEKEVCTLVIGVDEKRNAPVYEDFRIKTPAEARTVLVEYLASFHEWQAKDTAMPFAPETSLAYFEALTPNPDDQVISAALTKAENEWRPGERTFNEARNPDFFQAFGEAGPMAHPEFATIAEQVYRPMSGDPNARA